MQVSDVSAALHIVALFCGGLAAALPARAEAEEEGPTKAVVYIGTYASGEGEGIQMFEMDLGTGQTGPVKLAAEAANPSFLAVHPTRKFLYAVNEIGNYEGKKAGAVSAFAIDPDSGKLKLLNQQSSVGAGPCHLVVDHGGRNVLAANYGGGSVCVLPIANDGKLREASAFVQHEGSGGDPRRQKGPHAHSINVDAADRYAFAADLGLDKVLIYRFDPSKGSLEPGDPAAGTVAPASGPRHFAIHPSQRFAYVINELNSTITAFALDPKSGALEKIQNITTLPKGYDDTNYTAEVQVHPSGKFVYGSNRGHDSIAAFAVDPESGKLTVLGHESTGGKFPRNFGIDPTGKFLLAANQGSDNVVFFRIDPKTGELKPTGQELKIPKPVCVKFLRKSK